MLKPSYCFIWDVEKILGFLNSDRIEIKVSIYKVTMLLALERSFRAHEICYLDIRYLIKHSSACTFHSNKRQGKLIQDHPKNT